MSEPIKQDTHEPTNTYALLVPDPALFSADVMDLLHDFYSKFGDVLHWAPVRGLGRVIIVWDRIEAGPAARAVGGGSLTIRTQDSPAESGQSGLLDSEKHPANLTLRLFPLPATSQAILANLLQEKVANTISHNPEHPDPNRLAPPVHPRNFLVSPPGSPPEGWEPIAEEAPNDQTLASDLIKALESMQVDPSWNGVNRPRWIGSEEGEGEGSAEALGPSADIILQTSNGFTVAVQAPEMQDSRPAEPTEQVEYLFDPAAAGFAASGISNERATVDSMQGRYETSAGWRTPGLGERTYSGRPAPTARPPVV